MTIHSTSVRSKGPRAPGGTQPGRPAARPRPLRGLGCARMKHVARPVVSLAMILVCTGATMAVGTVLKAPCANGRLVRRASVPLPLLLRRRPTARHRAAHGQPAPVRQRVREGAGTELRRVPGPHDVLHARVGLDLGSALRLLLLRERGAAGDLRAGDRLAPLHDGRGAGALLRARSDAPRLRHDELGSARGDVRHRRPLLPPARSRRPLRRHARPRGGRQVLPGDAGGAASSHTGSRSDAPTRPSRSDGRPPWRGAS